MTLFLDDLCSCDGNEETCALFQALWDCANTLLASVEAKEGQSPVASGCEKVIKILGEDGRKAKEAADAFRRRGGSTAEEIHVGADLADEANAKAVREYLNAHTAPYPAKDAPDQRLPKPTISTQAHRCNLHGN